MNVLQSFTISTMKIHKKWTIVTVIGVIISAAMLSGVTTFTASFTDLIQREQISQSGKWTVHFTGIPASDAAIWNKSSSNNTAMVQKEVGYAELSGSKNPDKPYLYISQFDEASFKNFFVKVTSGRLPQNDREIVLPDDIALTADVHYSIGDIISEGVGVREFPDGTYGTEDSSYADEFYTYDEATGKDINLGPEKFVSAGIKTYTVVGFISPLITDHFWGAGYSCLTAGIPSGNEPTDLYVWTEGVPLNYYGQTRSMAAKLGYSANQIEFNDSYLRYCAVTDSGNRQDLMFTLVAVIVAIIIIASVSLIYNAFSISVSERTRHLGLLASAGATRKQKRVHVHFEGFLVGLMGIPLGILFGILGIKLTFVLISPVLAGVTDMGNMELHTIISGWTIGITALLSALTVYVSVLIPAIRASRIMPIDAIRQSREIRLTSRSIRTSPIFRRIFGFEAELAMKNFRRNRRKYRATIVSLVISLVLFLTVSSYVQFGGLYSQSSSQQIDYDLSLSIGDVPKVERDDIFEKISALPDVKSIAVVDNEGMFLISDKDIRTDLAKGTQYAASDTYIAMHAYNDASFTIYAKSLGVNPGDYMDPANPKGILINHTIEYNYDTGRKMIGDVLAVSQGDTLTAGYYTDTSYPAREGTDPASEILSADFEIGKITEALPVGTTYNQSFNEVSMIIPESVFMELREKSGISEENGRKNYGETTYIRSDNSKDLELQIREITKSVSSSQISLYNLSTMRDQNRNMMILIGVFVYGFITLISLICIANIFNTITTNAALRQKEFAMLRSVGMTPGSFNRMIRFESIFYGIKALILGLPISILISYCLYSKEMQVYSFAYSLPWMNYLIAIALVFIMVFATMMYSVSRINKSNIVDTLKMDTM